MVMKRVRRERKGMRKEGGKEAEQEKKGGEGGDEMEQKSSKAK